MENKVYLIGNAHIDPVWLWRKPEGLAEIKSTFRSALDRMKEFPDYVFTSACASYYKWIEEIDLEMFEEIKQRVKEGRWCIEGGMWVQPDCNIPSGESLARHALYSQRYFKEKFGMTVKTGYNVDSFGQNGMLPQLLKHSGIENYVFQRPDYNEKTNVPGHVFWWEAPDGSRVLAFRILFSYVGLGKSICEKPEYQGMHEYTAQAFEFKKIADEAGVPLMAFYGVGNHGGGPTIEALTGLEKAYQEHKDFIQFSGPTQYFDDLRASELSETLPVLKEDLQHHASGCYSANSAIKTYNRKAENSLLTAEKYDVMSATLTGAKQHTEEFKKAWDKVMFNQFHDIIAGCSIKPAYEEAYNAYGSACDTAFEIGNFAMQRISWRIKTTDHYTTSLDTKFGRLWVKEGEGAPFVVFNPHSFAIRTAVQIEDQWITGILDSNNNPVPLQIIRGPHSNGADKNSTLFFVDIPALGYATYYLYRHNQFDLPETSSLTAQDYQLENDKVCITFNKNTGLIASYYDKVNGRELSTGEMAKAVIIDDSKNDTWAHRQFEFAEELGVFTDAELEVVEEGPIRATIKITNYYNRSKLTQYFSLYHDSDELEVRCKLNFNEKKKILKFSFPVNVETPKATYSMPYGFIEKLPDGMEEPAQKWIDVSDTSGYGLSLLNDSKYSFSIKNNDMRMIVARGCAFADHFSEELDNQVDYIDQGEQEFTYVLKPHNTDCFASVVKRAAVLNQNVEGILETHHDGTLDRCYEGIKISEDNVIAEAIKYAEDGNGVVVRLYETAGRSTTANIDLALLNRSFSLTFKPQEILTVYIPADGGQIREVNFIEE